MKKTSNEKENNEINKIIEMKDLDLLYNYIKNELRKYKNDEIKQIGDNDEDLDFLKETYFLYNNKLECIKTIDNLENNNSIQKRFFSITKKIISLNNNDKQKILLIISYISLIKSFKYLHEKNDDEILLLSSSSKYLDMEDYTYYIGIIINDEVLNAIINKTNNFSEQIKIIKQIMNSQDKFNYDYISPDNYYELIDNALEIVKSYEIPLICKECNSEFNFPNFISVDDLINHGMNLDEATEILKKRDSLKSMINNDKDVDRKIIKDYLLIEKQILSYSNSFSNEYYKFYDYTKKPIKCLNCRKK